MEFSVIIPTFNRINLISNAVDSVLSQTYKNYEIIVIDDGSIDGTTQYIHDLYGDRVKLITKKNGGVSSARNAGIRKASGNIIAFLDSDDTWHKDYLLEISHVFENYSVDYVFTDLIKYYGSVSQGSFMITTPVFSKLIQLNNINKELVEISVDEMYWCLLQEVPIKPSALTITRAAVAKIGGFSEEMVSGEDWDYLIRLSRQHKCIYVNKTLVNLNVTSDSLHLINKEKDAFNILELLKQEMSEIKKSDNCHNNLTAVINGLVGIHKQLAWYYLENNNRKKAIYQMFQGYKDTGEMLLLLRCLKYMLYI